MGGSYQVMGKRNDGGVHPSEPTEWSTFYIAPGGTGYFSVIPLFTRLLKNYTKGHKKILITMTSERYLLHSWRFSGPRQCTQFSSLSHDIRQ